jgi:aspartate aminotransferase
MFFQEVSEGPPDAIFGLLGAFAADVRPNKVNLLVGIYKDEHLKSDLLPSVRKAKEQVMGEDLLADFLPIDGMADLIGLLGVLVFGESCWEKEGSRIYGAQTVGGTSALRIGAELLAQEVTGSVFIPNQTWPNHRSIFERAKMRVDTYPYYSGEKIGFDFQGMLDCLESLPSKTAVVLHASCHNPSGCDPTLGEWKEISKVMRRKKLFPFFDFAYQGLGDVPEKDAASVRVFREDGHEMAIAYSCSKNFSMYCQRVGALFIVAENPSVKLRVGSQVKRIIRANYSNPPAHGGKIVVHILKNEDLKKKWLQDLESIRHRLNSIREKFVERLLERAKKTDFRYLRSHKGMFSFVDLEKKQVQEMISKYGIYLLDNGRINVAGLTEKNLDAVVNGLIAVCEP